MARLSDFAGSRELTINLTQRELKGRYKRSILGWTWSLLNPLATVAIYTLVFSYFLKIDPPTGDPSGLKNFALFLVCALVPWTFFANSVNGSMSSLLVNSNIIKKVYFPRELIVVSTILSLLVTMAIEIAVVGVILLLVGNMVLPWIPVLLALMAVQTVFVLGVGLVLAPCNVYYRDIQHLVGIALQVLFYLTPTVYPLTLVPKTADIAGVEIPVRTIYQLNPLVQFVEAYRDVLYDLRFPSLADWGYLMAWAVALFALGLWVFGKLDHRLAEEV
jgi:ABC-2 type transport system permease protein